MKYLAGALTLSLLSNPAFAEVDTAARERLLEAFKLSFANECETRTQNFLDEAVYHEIAPAEGDEQKRPRTLGIFLCARGAYNQTHAVLLDDGTGFGTDALAFVEPELDVKLEDGRDDEDPVLERIGVRGFHATRIVFNAEFDPAALTLRTGGLWRGLGDAASSGTHVLRGRQFMLQTYQADPTYDGKVVPYMLIEDGRTITPRAMPDGD